MFDDEVPGVHRFFFFFLMIRRPPRSTLFPYTTALPIYADVLVHESTYGKGDERMARNHGHSTNMQAAQIARDAGAKRDRKSTRLNSSHANISYAVFCLKKNTLPHDQTTIFLHSSYIYIL